METEKNGGAIRTGGGDGNIISLPVTMDTNAQVNPLTELFLKQLVSKKERVVIACFSSAAVM